MAANARGPVRAMADRVGRVVGYLRHADPQPTLSRRALAVDAGIAVAATIAALVTAITGDLHVGSYALTSGRASPVTPIPPTQRPPLPVAPTRPPRPPHIPVPPHHLVTHALPVPVWALVLIAATTLPLVFRRVYPASSFCVILIAVIATHGYSTLVTVGSAIFAAYCAVVYSKYRRAALLTLVAGAVIITVAYPEAAPRVPERYTALLVLLPTVALGNMMRVWRQRAGDSAERLRRAQEEHEADTRRAVDLERARIASELHDVVTHNVSVMVVQAGAARRVLESSPDAAEAARIAREALLAVEGSGRNAMTDLRHLLGLLAPAGAEQASAEQASAEQASAEQAAGAAGSGGATGSLDGPGPADADASFRPQPGVAQLPALLGRVCSAGLPVELNVVAPARTRRPLPPGVDLAVYRVVQEALTNVIKYAPQARTVVRLEYRTRELRVTVSNDERPADSADPMPGPPSAPGGRGLLGLRERVVLYGGDLDAGPRPGGGWRVSARIPLESDGPDGEEEVQVIRTEFQAASS